MKKFFQYPINAVMLDPNTPPYDPVTMALKYLGIIKDGVKANVEQVEAIRESTIAYCRSVDDPETFERDLAGIEAMWPEMRERFLKSASLTQLVLDFFVNSRYMLRYLWLTGRHQFAVALAIKDGLAIPASGGVVLEEIPESDAAWLVVTVEPVHVARRQTDYCCQDLIRKAKVIFEFGAGILPAYSRLYDYPLGENGQKIIACDSNEKVLDYLPSMLGADVMSKLTYVTGDARKIAANPELEGSVTIARMTGFLSYFETFEEKLEFARLASKMIEPGGIIVSDLWTAGYSLARSGGTTLWPSDGPVRLIPEKDVPTAKNLMEDIAKEVGLKCVHMVDQCNGNPNCLTQVKAKPKCVMTLLGRDVSQDMFNSIW